MYVPSHFSQPQVPAPVLGFRAKVRAAHLGRFPGTILMYVPSHRGHHYYSGLDQ